MVMRILYNTSNNSIVDYPRFDNEDVIDLDPIYIVLTKIESPSPNYTSIMSWEVDLDNLEYRQVWTESTPSPDWEGFIKEFTSVGNTLYNSTASKVQNSGVIAIEHWTNIRIGLSSPSIRNEEWLQLAYSYLDYLLSESDNPFTQEEKESWISLANSYHVPLANL